MRVLIIGLGSAGRRHTAAIKKIEPGAEIYALRSGKNTVAEPGVIDLFSYDDVPGDIDFIVISNPTALHQQSIIECTRFGCPLFIEKPALSDMQHAGNLISQLKEKNILTYIACNMRFHPALVFMKKWLQDEDHRINEINIYCGSYLPDWRPGRNFRDIYSSQTGMGGGVHLDLIHELDYCVWLFGLPERVNAMKTSLSSLVVDSIDCARYQLQYPGFTAAVTLNYFRRIAKREMEIITAEDVITVNLLDNRIVGNASGTELYHEEFDISSTYLTQMQYFIDGIRKGKIGMNSIEEGMDILKIALHE